MPSFVDGRIIQVIWQLLPFEIRLVEEHPGSERSIAFDGKQLYDPKKLDGKMVILRRSYLIIPAANNPPPPLADLTLLAMMMATA